MRSISPKFESSKTGGLVWGLSHLKKVDPQLELQTNLYKFIWNTV